MKSLQEYIVENIVDIFEAYNISFPKDNENSLSLTKNKFQENGFYSAKIENIIIWLYKNANTNYPIIFSDKEKKSVKIQPANWNIFINYLKEKKYDIDIDPSKNYITFEGIKFIQGKGTPGSESNIKITTDQQENMTCKFINTFIDLNKQSIKEIDIFNNINLFTDEEQKWFDDKSWLNTWILQYNSIINFLNVNNFNITKIKAFRYGDKNDTISSLLTNLHDILIKESGKSSKDIINPADIFIYDTNKLEDNENYIIPTLNKLISMNVDSKQNKETPILKQAQAEFKKLFENKCLLGISLKKLNVGSNVDCDLLNYKNIDSYKNLSLKRIIYDPLIYFLNPQKNGNNIIKEFEELSEKNELNFLTKCEENLTRQLTLELHYKDGNPKLICRTAGIKNTIGEKPSIAIMGSEGSSAKALNGRCEADYWKSLLAKYNNELNNIYDNNGNPNKQLKYNYQEITNDWANIINISAHDQSKKFNIEIKDKYYNNINDYIKATKKLFMLLQKYESKLKCEVFVFYVQLHIIKALYEAHINTNNNIPNENDLVKSILLGCRKERTDALMYLYVHN